MADIGKSGKPTFVAPTGLIGFGLLCLLAAAVGGSVKGLGFELPSKIDQYARFQVALLGLVTIVAGSSYRWWPLLTTAVRARLDLKRHSLHAPLPVRPIVGRQEELKQIESELRATSRVSITGLGGVGKTRIAIEYVRLYRSSYPNGIFWLRGETKQELTADFATIAGSLVLPMVALSNEEIKIKAIHDWLRERPDVLLVIDNLEEAVVSTLNRLVAGLSAHVLATSRYPWWGRPVVVGPLPPDAARKLLQEGGDRHDEKSADLVAEELGGLPIALEQAASYMRETGQGVAGFYELLTADPARLFAWKAVDPEVRPVAVTWSLSIERIERKSPAAADLLRFCVFLGTEEIPIRIIMEACDKLPDPLRAVAGDRLKLDAAISTLLTYSIVERRAPASAPDEDSLLVHRLVQRVVRHSLTKKQQRQWSRVAAGVSQPEVPRIDRMATAAVICGILALPFGPVPSVAAIWLGKRAESRIKWSGGLVLAGNWTVVSHLAAGGVRLNGKQGTRLTFQCNEWLARKRESGVDAIRQEVTGWDTSALNIWFQFAQACLLDDLDRAYDLAGSWVKEPSAAAAVREWPLCQEFRADPRYGQLFTTTLIQTTASKGRNRRIYIQTRGSGACPARTAA